MKVEVPKGKYVLAVSGGVDSMVLLDLLARKPAVELFVAHFNHGIRPDSNLDEQLVAKTAQRLKLPFRVGYGRLEPAASEEKARSARYNFLNQVKAELAAGAIITAHHQDDLIETAFINLIRGTNRLGLSSMVSGDVLRPLLEVTKPEIRSYAKKNRLQWREDKTNQNTDYLRNYLRLTVLPKLSDIDRGKLLKSLDKVAKLNIKINNDIATLSYLTDDRIEFSNLPTKLAQELVAHRLRQADLADIDSKTIRRLSLAIKTAKPDSSHHIKQSAYLKLTQTKAVFVTP